VRIEIYITQIIKGSKKTSKRTERKTKWDLPSDGWVKLNVDGSFVQQNGGAGVGVIACDSKGQVILMA